MATGHVFVFKGSIGKLVADAAVVATNAVLKVESYWTMSSPPRIRSSRATTGRSTGRTG